VRRRVLITRISIIINLLKILFRICVALVLREFAAVHYKLTDPTAVTQNHIISYIGALNKSYAELIGCIYIALCGREANTEKAKQS